MIESVLFGFKISLSVLDVWMLFRYPGLAGHRDDVHAVSLSSRCRPYL